MNARQSTFLRDKRKLDEVEPVNFEDKISTNIYFGIGLPEWSAPPQVYQISFFIHETFYITQFQNCQEFVHKLCLCMY